MDVAIATRVQPTLKDRVDNPDDFQKSELNSYCPAPEQDSNIDWSSVEEVSSHVSRSTLAGMQQLWKQHAGCMDAQGKAFAQSVYSMHSQAVKDVASMKSFELKPVLGLLNSFTSGVRESVLEVFQQMRQQDDDFAQHMYQASRRTFTRNLKSALEARDTWYQDKIKGLKNQHNNQLTVARAAAAAELKQLKQQLANELAVRTASREQRRVSLAAASAAAAAAATAAAISNAAADAASGIGGGNAASAALLLQAAAGARPGSAALAAAAAAAAGSRQGTPTMSALPAVPEAFLEEDSFEGDGMFPGSHAFGMVGKGAAEAMAALEEARAASEELRAKVDTMTMMVQIEKGEVASWRNKWAQESSKTEGIKRECLQIVTKCEDHVKSLQQQHLTELGQRDYILQRCKDTIVNLEARVTEFSGTQLVNPSDVQRILLLQQRPAPAPAAAAPVAGTLGTLNAQQASGVPRGMIQVPPGYGYGMGGSSRGPSR